MRRSFVALASTLVVSPAAAHLSQSVTQTSRFVEVVASGTEIRIRYAVGFGQVPAALERRRMDLDHDADVTSAERDAWRESMERRLGRQVRVTVAGRNLPARFGGVLHMSDTRLGEIAFVAIFTAHFPLPGAGPQTLSLSDRFDPPRPGELEIRFLEDVGARFIESRLGDGAPSRRRSVTFRGPRRSEIQERRISFRFETNPARAREAAAHTRSAPPAGATSDWSAGRIALLAGVVIAAGIAAVLVVRRRRGG